MRNDIDRFKELLNYKHGYILESREEKNLLLEEVDKETAKSIADKLWDEISSDMPTNQELLNMIQKPIA